jgi:hypothetical protein
VNTEHIFRWVECRISGAMCLGTRAMHEFGTHVAEARLGGEWVVFDPFDLDSPTPVARGRAPSQAEAAREVALVARGLGLTVDPFAGGGR